MIRKFLAIMLLVLLFSCSSYENRTNFGTSQSKINNLSFKNIDKIKEYKSCSDSSLSIFRSLLIFPLFIPDSKEYDSLRANLVDNHGDSSISSTVKLGGITKIKMIDHSYEITGILSRKYCVIVYGE